MEDCVFCQIIAGEGPASVIYEDDIVVVFLDIAPVNPGHAMVVPKIHVPSLADMDERTGMHLFKITQRTAAAIRESGVRCEGVNLLLADGEAAFQEVFHLHMHVFPRFVGDPFKVIADWDAHPPRQELDEIAEKIGKAYQRLWHR